MPLMSFVDRIDAVHHDSTKGRISLCRVITLTTVDSKKKCHRFLKLRFRFSPSKFRICKLCRGECCPLIWFLLYYLPPKPITSSHPLHHPRPKLKAFNVAFPSISLMALRGVHWRKHVPAMTLQARRSAIARYLNHLLPLPLLYIICYRVLFRIDNVNRANMINNPTHRRSVAPA